MNQYIWARHDYIPIDPTNKIYKYDIIYSNNIRNNFYIGWERFEVNKTTRTNNATIYIIISPNTPSYRRITGTFNLSNHGLNPCAFIRIRILNKWNGFTINTNGTATIHFLSLKQFESGKDITPIDISQQEIANATSILEKDIGVSINRSFDLNSNNFYEI